MDDLPDLPFEQVLSYLSLKDVIKSRRVSKTWKIRIDTYYRVKSLCCSCRCNSFIEEKSRWVSGEFAQNFVRFDRFPQCFFYIFNRTILSNLKHLRLGEVSADPELFEWRIIQSMQSFQQLQELDIFFTPWYSRDRYSLHLSMPMLRRIHIECYKAVDHKIRLTLNAPRLQEIRMDFGGEIKLVHEESVERVSIGRLFHNWNEIQLKRLKNLKNLYIDSGSLVEPALLSFLEKLNEVHLNHSEQLEKFFEQKQQYGPADLKIYLRGLLLSGPEDPAIHFLTDSSSDEWFVHWAENQPRLVDVIPYHFFNTQAFRYESARYSTIERVAPEVAINVLKRFTDFDYIKVDEPVQSVPRFLDFLKNFSNIDSLDFESDQPQELFDRLPEQCVVRNLFLHCPPPDLQFLFRLKYLVHLNVRGTFDAETIRKILEELEFISSFDFNFANKRIKIDVGNGFHVLVGESPTGFFQVSSSEVLANIEAAILFIVNNTRSNDSRWKIISRKLFSF